MTLTSGTLFLGERLTRFTGATPSPPSWGVVDFGGRRLRLILTGGLRDSHEEADGEDVDNCSVSLMEQDVPPH